MPGIAMSAGTDRKGLRAPLWLWAISPITMLAAAVMSLTGLTEAWLILLAAISTTAARLEQPELFQKRRNLAFHWVGSLVVLIVVSRLTALIARYFGWING